MRPGDIPSTEASATPAAPPNGGRGDGAVARFAEAFDAGLVTWADDVPVFGAPVVPAALPRRGPPITPGDLAWLAAAPVGLIALAACFLASGPAKRLMPAASWTAFPTLRQWGWIRPEPVDQFRYLVSLVAPVLVLGLAWYGWKQLSGRARRRRLDTAVIAVQVVGVLVLAVCWVVQRRYHGWFSGWSLLAALGVTCLSLAVARRTKVFSVGEATPASWVAQGLALGAAVVLSALWLLPSVFDDANLADADEMVRYHLQFTFDDFLSVRNGRTPLVDFVPVYARLLPFVAAPVLGIFGPTVGTLTWTMWLLSLGAVVAVYGMLCVVTRKPLAALGLYVPFLAVTMVSLTRVGDERVYLANLYGVMPLRLVGPFVLAWLCARQLRRPRRGGPIALFFLAGLVAVNNPEFGVPSFLAVLVALWCGHEGPLAGWRAAWSYVKQAALGGAASVAVLSLLTLARSSSLPRLDYLNHFQRVFAVEGFGMVPMPALGLHVAIYLTFVGALVGAMTTRLAGRPPVDRVLAGMLAYSAVLGLGALSYWVGRSHELSLFAMFPTWGLCVSLLAWWVLDGVARHPSPAPSKVRLWALPGLAVLLAFGLMASTVSQFPSPGRQLRRVSGTSSASPIGQPVHLLRPGPSFDRSAAARFVAEHTARGERVGILASLGHGIAERSGVVNVSPYAFQDSIGFEEQMAFVLETMEEAGATKIFLGPAYPEIASRLEREGYSVTARSRETLISLYTRRR